MKKSVIIALLGPGLFIFAEGSRFIPASGFPFKNPLTIFVQQEKKATDVRTVYSCPMHPEIMQDKTGKCPKCGMALKATNTNKDNYTCPMHPEVVQTNQGKCPKCGMALVLKAPLKKSESSKKTDTHP